MKALVRTLRGGLETVGELLRLFSSDGRWWLLPMIIVLLLFGLVLLLASSSPLGPFIYTLF